MVSHIVEKENFQEMPTWLRLTERICLRLAPSKSSLRRTSFTRETLYKIPNPCLRGNFMYSNKQHILTVKV